MSFYYFIGDIMKKLIIIIILLLITISNMNEDKNIKEETKAIFISYIELNEYMGGASYPNLIFGVQPYVQMKEVKDI